MEIEEVSKIMAIIAKEYAPLFPVDEERMGLWCLTLQHATYEEAASAVKYFLAHGDEYPPRLPVFNKQILVMRYQELRRRELCKPALPAPEPSPEVKGKCLNILRNCLQNMSDMKLKKLKANDAKLEEAMK